MRAPEFWQKKSFITSVLQPLGFLYDLAGRVRWMIIKPMQAQKPVICVGNFVVGGAGKTPVSLSIAQYLQNEGLNIHFLCSGYGGYVKGPLLVDLNQHTAQEVGDEALLLAAIAPTWVGRNRSRTAKRAIREGADILVMDDGFQNPTLKKNKSIVVVDGEYGLGNRLVMPAGPLREKLSRGLERADAIVIIGEDKFGLKSEFQKTHFVTTAKLVPDPIFVENFKNRRVVAFAAIARPEKFFKTLHQAGTDIIARHIFPDHYNFHPKDLESIIQTAERENASMVTTTKDAVKLPESLKHKIDILKVDLDWHNQADLKNFLKGVG